MADLSPPPDGPASSPQARVDELHQLAAADYASTAHLRQLNPTWPTRPAGIRTAAVPQTDHPVVRHANGLEFRVIPADSYTARMARDIRQLTMADGTVWTVGAPIGWHGVAAAWRPAVEPPAQRCPAAHPEDPTPCGGPVVVTVLDAQNAGADGCEHHGARLLASLDGGRVYALPDAPDGAAIRTFKTAATLRPFAWLAPEGGERR